LGAAATGTAFGSAVLGATAIGVVAFGSAKGAAFGELRGFAAATCVSAGVGATGAGAGVGATGAGAGVGTTGAGAGVGTTGAGAGVGTTGAGAGVGTTGAGAGVGTTGAGAGVGTTGAGAGVGGAAAGACAAGAGAGVASTTVGRTAATSARGFADVAATGGGRADSEVATRGASVVPSTRMPAWHCLHLMVTTRPLTLRSYTSSAMENVFWQAVHVMGNGIRTSGYTDRPAAPQIWAIHGVGVRPHSASGGTNFQGLAPRPECVRPVSGTLGGT